MASLRVAKFGLKVDSQAVLGLGPRDARFHTLNYFQDKCANFASIISKMVNK